MIPKYMRTLRRNIDSTFSEEDLKGLAFDLAIDWDHLQRDTKPEIIRSLILHQLQRGKLSDVILLLREERPNEIWEDPPSEEQQIKDGQAHITEAERRDLFDQLLKEIGPLAAGVAQMKSLIEAKIDCLDPSQMAILIRFLAGYNLAGYISFESVCLENQELMSLNLNGINLRKANLKRARLEGSSLVNADLMNANLDHADIRAVNLTGANLRPDQLDRALYYDSLITPDGKDGYHGGGWD